MFHPAPIYPVPPPGTVWDTPPNIDYGTTTTPPAPGAGRVVLRFYDMNGLDVGWVALYVPKNQTRYLEIADVAKYLGQAIEGSVRIEPPVALQLELAHTTGQAHASTGVWLGGQ